jgi:hypothetical protein
MCPYESIVPHAAFIMIITRNFLEVWDSGEVLGMAWEHGGHVGDQAGEG